MACRVLCLGSSLRAVFARQFAYYSTTSQKLATAAREAPAADTIPTDMEQSTGLERRELEAILSGNTDPFNLSLNRGPPGTKDSPTFVPSMFEERIIGCICEEDSTTINWMVLKKGALQRCSCGNCFKLVAGSSNSLKEEHH